MPDIFLPPFFCLYPEILPKDQGEKWSRPQGSTVAAFVKAPPSSSSWRPIPPTGPTSRGSSSFHFVPLSRPPFFDATCPRLLHHRIESPTLNVIYLDHNATTPIAPEVLGASCAVNVKNRLSKQGFTKKSGLVRLRMWKIAIRTT